MRRDRISGGDRGTSILEFALITPVMVLLVMGVIDLARAYQTQMKLTNAAREGAAYAQIAPNDVDCATGDDITSRVAAESDVASLPAYAVTVLAADAGGEPTVPVTGCGGSTAEGGERVRVEVSADFELFTPMIERVVGETIALVGTSEIEVQE